MRGRSTANIYGAGSAQFQEALESNAELNMPN